MSDIAIQVDQIWKKYRLGVVSTGTLTHDLNRWVHHLRGKPDPYIKVGDDGLKTRRQRLNEAVTSPSSNSSSLLASAPAPLEEDEIWALYDVSFEIEQGEILGIIGKNGAGKSTLLKILSRVTAPTSGEVRIKGRVASLLEVGTGFHPELTGRENIFLNGAILGMSKAEIKTKFDEIVAFAEVEKFIDTPVKRYSSGMYVRLAFAVAAHLDPEILIVDEVLAVGDASFQKKCLGKMGDVSRQGRTVLFVSHNMAAIKALCTHVVLLMEGTITQIGDVNSVVNNYLESTISSSKKSEWTSDLKTPEPDSVSLQYVRILPPANHTVITVDSGEVIEFRFWMGLQIKYLACSIIITNADGILLFESGQILSADNHSERGWYDLTVHIPPFLLNAGRYLLTIVIGKDKAYVLHNAKDIISFEIENTASGLGQNMSASPGVIRPQLQWNKKYTATAS